MVTSSEWAKHALSMLGESLAKCSKPLEYEPEGAVKYSSEDCSPANEQTGASGGSASDLRPEGDIFEFNMLRPRRNLTNETWSPQPYLKFPGNLGEHGPYHGKARRPHNTQEEIRIEHEGCALDRCKITNRWSKLLRSKMRCASVHSGLTVIFACHFLLALYWTMNIETFGKSIYTNRKPLGVFKNVNGAANSTKISNSTTKFSFSMSRENQSAMFVKSNLQSKRRTLRPLRSLNSSAVKIISFSLFGNDSRYTDGALVNANLITDFFTNWTMRVYHDRSVPDAVLIYLRERNVELVDMSNSSLKNQMVWRFLPAGEKRLERFVSRDIDARLSAREAAAVEEWEESDLPFSVMRDHPSHRRFNVSGGMWGSKGGAIIDIQKRLEGGNLSNEYANDMRFLNSEIWPVMLRDGVMVHDAFACNRSGPEVRPFPTARQGAEHVGSVYIDGTVRQKDKDILLSAIATGCPIPRKPDSPAFVFFVILAALVIAALPLTAAFFVGKMCAR